MRKTTKTARPLLRLNKNVLVIGLALSPISLILGLIMAVNYAGSPDSAPALVIYLILAGLIISPILLVASLFVGKEPASLSRPGLLGVGLAFLIYAGLALSMFQGA